MIATPDEPWVISWESDAEGRLEGLPAQRDNAVQSSHEALDQGWIEAVHQDDRSALIAALRQASADQAPFRMELRLRLEGGPRRALVAAAPRFGVDRAFLGHIGTVAELTERCRGETSLCESGTLDRCALQALPAHIVVLDRQGRIIVTNRAWEQFAAQNQAAQSQQVAVGANYLDVCRRAAGADDEFSRRALTGLEAVLNGEQDRFSMEYPCHGPQAERWFYMTVAPLSGPGEGGVVVTHMDVTERKQAEAAMRRSEERYRAFAQASSDMVYRISPDWTEIRHLVGREFIADTLEPCQTWLQKCIHPDDQPHVLAAIKKAIRTKSVFEMEHRVLRVDGGAGWTHLRAIPILADSGDIVEWFGMASDVTARKDADEALRKSEARYRTLFNSIDQGYCVIRVLFDLAGKPNDYLFEEVNAVFAKQTGITDAVGRSMRDIAPSHEAFWFETYGRIAATGEAERFEHQASALNRWYDVFAYRIGEPDEHRVAVLFNDITVRKRAEVTLRVSEARYRSLVDAASAITWSCPPSGLQIEPQPDWMAFTGQSAKEMLGDGWTKVVHPDDLAATAAKWQEAVTLGAPFANEQRIRRQDGLWRWMSVQAVPIRNEQGDIVEWFGMNIDVTEQREAQAALRDRNRQLDLLARTSQRLLLDTESEDDLLTSIFSDIADEIGVESYYHFRPTKPKLLSLSICGGVSDEEQRLFATMRFGDLLCGQVAETQTRLVIEDLQHSGQPGSEILNAAGATSYAGFPLVANGELFGTLAFISRERTHFRDGDMQVIQSICDQIAIVLERRRLGRELQRSEERLRLALDAGRLAMWDWQIATGEIVWNDAHYRLLGYEPGSTTPSYRAWANRVHPDDLRRVETTLQQSIDEGREYNEEYRALWPNGNLRFLEAHGRFLRDSKGHPLRGYGVIQDITERKQAEDALRRTEERLRRVLETDAVGVLFFDREGYLIDANDVFLRTTGYTRNDISARALHWRNMTPPEYIAESAAQMAGFASTGRIGPYEKEYILRDGSRRWMLFAGRDLGDGTIAEYCVDISKRKAVEAALHDADSRFRAMADTAPVLIWETDANGVTFVNGHYLDFFGVGFESIAGMGWAGSLHPEDRAGYLKAYSEAFKTRSFFTFDSRFRRADGEYRWMRNAGRPLNDHKFVGCSLDITELKNAEEVLRESDRRKDEFLATLAHELRNPLTPIRNAAQILKKKYGPDAKDAVLFDMVERQTKHLVRLVDDLLEISRISRGKIALRKEKVDMATVLRDALEACQPLIDSKGHRVTSQIAAEPLSVSGDPVRLVQIATNLINNAAKYTLPGGVIDIDVAREGTEAVFRVRDTGVGIDPKIIPRIFDVFAQTEAHSRLAEGGLGIGLAVVSKLVGLHGGSIEAHSDGLGKGSEFAVRLPLVVDATQAVTQS